MTLDEVPPRAIDQRGPKRGGRPPSTKARREKCFPVVVVAFPSPLQSMPGGPGGHRKEDQGGWVARMARIDPEAWRRFPRGPGAHPHTLFFARRPLHSTANSNTVSSPCLDVGECIAASPRSADELETLLVDRHFTIRWASPFHHNVEFTPPTSTYSSYRRSSLRHNSNRWRHASTHRRIAAVVELTTVFSYKSCHGVGPQHWHGRARQGFQK